MEYVHIKNLEKYHPGYKDRALIWCKAYFKMINADPEFEMLQEIDKWRYMAFIMLELQTQKPIPLDGEYLKRKGFDLKKRPISKTINMLRKFISTVTEDSKSCVIDKEEEYSLYKEEEDIVDYKNIQNQWNDFAKKHNLSEIQEINQTRKGKIKARLKEKGFDLKILFQNIEKQPFLLGSNEKGWAIDFDWIFKKENYMKIMELKYLKRKKGSMSQKEIKDYEEYWSKEDGKD